MYSGYAWKLSYTCSKGWAAWINVLKVSLPNHRCC